MLKWFLQRKIRGFGQHYDYDTAYMQHMLDVDSRSFMKFSLINVLSGHRKGIPTAPWFAASLRACLAEDCGPCVQLISNMALETGVSPEVVSAILSADKAALDEDTALVLQFTELTLARNPEADALRDDIRDRWGEDALISIGFAISATQVYPKLKYALGYGKACERIIIDQQPVIPSQV